MLPFQDLSDRYQPRYAQCIMWIEPKGNTI